MNTEKRPKIRKIRLPFVIFLLTACFLSACQAAGAEDAAAETDAVRSSDPSEAEAFKSACGALLEISREYLPQDEGVLKQAEQEDPLFDDIYEMLQETGAYPVYDDVQTEYYTSGQEALGEMLNSIKDAREYIFMEYFVLDDGELWDEISEALYEKAAQGVEVRVMYDGWPAQSRHPEGFAEGIRALGIDCRTFLAADVCHEALVGNRNHRKIMIVDGKCVFSGGMNLADEYVNYTHPYGYWKDNGMKLRGDAVKSYLLMFLQDWYNAAYTPESSEEEREQSFRAEVQHYLATTENGEHIRDGGFCMPYGDTPFDDCEAGRNVYIGILKNATSYVHITTPYFAPEQEMLEVITEAAQRGVEVTIVMPETTDVPIVQEAARISYPMLIEAGVQIYEYTPGFIHQKVFVSDDVRAVIGTINLDSRSLQHHFECATYFFETGIVGEAEEDFQRILTESKRITEEEMQEWEIRDGDVRFLHDLTPFL